MPDYLTRDQLAEYVGKRVRIERITPRAGDRESASMVLLRKEHGDIWRVRVDGFPGFLDLSRVTAIREAEKGES